MRTAVSRSGLTILPPAPYEGRPDLDPLAGRKTAAEAFHGILEPGALARFAVFAAADEAELLERGSAPAWPRSSGDGCCTAVAEVRRRRIPAGPVVRCRGGVRGPVARGPGAGDPGPGG
ncbi:hypothetical protein SF23_18160, partial [Streptomyces sp. MBRL 10]